MVEWDSKHVENRATDEKVKGMIGNRRGARTLNVFLTKLYAKSPSTRISTTLFYLKLRCEVPFFAVSGVTALPRSKDHEYLHINIINNNYVTLKGEGLNYWDVFSQTSHLIADKGHKNLWRHCDVIYQVLHYSFFSSI